MKRRRMRNDEEQEEELGSRLAAESLMSADADRLLVSVRITAAGRADMNY